MAGPGFGIPWPIVWGMAGGGGGVPEITDNTIGTNDYSPHPINCIMMQEEPLGNVKQRVTDWFGGARTVTEAATATKSSTMNVRKGEFRIPKSWKQ